MATNTDGRTKWIIETAALRCFPFELVEIVNYVVMFMGGNQKTKEVIMLLICYFQAFRS